jgi:hypothetical protein
MADSLGTRLATVAAEFVAPLRTAAESPAGLRAYLAGLGWDLAGLTGLEAVLSPLGEAVSAAETLAKGGGRRGPRPGLHRRGDRRAG